MQISSLPRHRRLFFSTALCGNILLLAATPALADGTLPAVSVEGQASNTNGVVHGYTAKRSDAGTKTNTRLIETPQSITVIPHQQIVQQDAQTLNQILHYTAGVATETRGGIATRYDLLTIRGFTADYYLDGMKLLTNEWYTSPQIDPYLLERVDVIKGPASVLYGAAEAGGLVDQISKKPTATPYHELGFELGNDAHYQATFDMSGPLTADNKWLYRVTGIGYTENGQIKTTQNQRLAIAPVISWVPDADTNLTLSMMYQHDPKASSYGSVPSEGTVLPSVFGRLPNDFYDGDVNYEKFNRTQISLGYAFTTRLADGLQLNSKARWFHTDMNYQSVYSSGLAGTVAPDNSTLLRGTADSRENTGQVTLDNNAVYVVNTGPVEHTLLVGTDYQHLSSQVVAGFGSAPSMNLLDPAPDNYVPIDPPSTSAYKIKLDQIGLYAQDQARWNGFVLTLSGRGDWADTYSSSAYSVEDQYNRAFTGRAGLNYVFANGIAPYISYATSFTPIPGVTGADNTPDKPETGAQTEIGIKYQPPGTKTLLTAAVFTLTRHNLVTQDLIDPSLSFQTGAARSRGLELEAHTSLTDNLNIVASYSYLNTIYTSYNPEVQGKHLPAVPQNMGSIWADYALPQGALEGLSAGAGVRYTGSTYSDMNTFKVKSVTLLDGTLSYDLGTKLPRLQGTTLYLNGRNLLNKTYVASCYYGDWCAYGYARQVMGGVRYHW